MPSRRMTVRNMVFKYATALVVAFELLLWCLPTYVVIENLLPKKDYSPDTDYSSDPALNARLAYGLFGDTFTQFLLIGIVLGGGFFFSLLLWNKKERKRPFNIVYCMILLGMVPLALINYGQSDQMIDTRIQGLIYINICAAGCVLLLKTAIVDVQTKEQLLHRTLTLFLLLTQAVLVPGIYAMLWLWNKGELIEAARAHTFVNDEIFPDFMNSYPTWISYVTIIPGIIIAILLYRRGRLTLRTAATNDLTHTTN